MSDSEEQNITNTSHTPPKKVKRLCTFRDLWLNSYTWLRKSENNNLFGNCKLCKKDFLITHGGKSDVQHHANSVSHRQKESSSKKLCTINSFFVTKNTLESQQVNLAEVSKIVHNIKHNLSYNSLDCDFKLLPKIFSDSNIASKISCGRTKAEAIVQNLLGPKAEEIIVNALKNISYFSVATDTSNKGNRKMYPIVRVVQYFCLQTGCQIKLLDFFEQACETADGISNSVLSTLEKYNINMSKVSAFSADNTNSNFGCRRSAFTLLQSHNKNIFKAGCLAHVVHNTYRKALDGLDFDLETLVLKIYAHFSVSASRREDLKEFVLYAELEWQELVKHCPTRWLSIGPAIQKILKFYPALISYFISLGEDCPKQIKKLLFFEEDESEIEYLFKKPSIYLHFCANVTIMFEKASKLLQKSETSSPEIFYIMNELKTNISTRINEQFYGSNFITCKNKLSVSNINTIKKDFDMFYNTALTYLSNHFDYEYSPLKFLEPLCLKSNLLLYQDIAKIIEVFGLVDVISLDEIFEEFTIIKPAIPTVSFENNLTVYEKWLEFLSIQKLKNFEILLEFILSIPPSNSHVERVFSMIN